MSHKVLSILNERLTTRAKMLGIVAHHHDLHIQDDISKLEPLTSMSASEILNAGLELTHAGLAVEGRVVVSSSSPKTRSKAPPSIIDLKNKFSRLGFKTIPSNGEHQLVFRARDYNLLRALCRQFTAFTVDDYIQRFFATSEWKANKTVSLEAVHTFMLKAGCVQLNARAKFNISHNRK